MAGAPWGAGVGVGGFGFGVGVGVGVAVGDGVGDGVGVATTLGVGADCAVVGVPQAASRPPARTRQSRVKLRGVSRPG